MMFWLDFETGGLDPREADPIEIAIVTTDKDGNILKSFESKIKPSRPVQEAAAKVNNYTIEAWATAPNLAEVKQLFIPIFQSDERYMPSGWNTPFDLKFWEYFGFDGSGKIKFGYHPYDLFGAYYHKFRNFPRIKLEAVYTHIFDEFLPGVHTAMGDVRACIRLYQELLK